MVTTTISANFSIGPILRGVWTPERLSITHTLKTPDIWGEHRLQRPALSVRRISKPLFKPPVHAALDIIDEEVVGTEFAGVADLDGHTGLFVPFPVKGGQAVKLDDAELISAIVAASCNITDVFPEDGGPATVTIFIPSLLSS